MTQNTRKDPRAKVVSLNVRYKSATVDEFIENHSHDVSRGGIFIKTGSPFAQGTLLKFEIRIASDQRVIAGVGRVVWRRDVNDSGDGRPAGMGVKFIKLDESSRGVIDRLVSAKGGKLTYDDDDEVTALRDSSGKPLERGPGGPTTVRPPPARPPTRGAAQASKHTMMGIGVVSVPPPQGSANTPSAKPGKPSFFPDTKSKPPEEPTVMRQAAELLEEALKEAGGSPDEIGTNPLFSKAPAEGASKSTHERPDAPQRRATQRFGSEAPTRDASPDPNRSRTLIDPSTGETALGGAAAKSSRSRPPAPTGGTTTPGVAPPPVALSSKSTTAGVGSPVPDAAPAAADSAPAPAPSSPSEGSGAKQIPGFTTAGSSNPPTPIASARELASAPSEEKKGGGLTAILAVAALVVVGGGGVMAYRHMKGEGRTDQHATTAPTTAPTKAPTATAPTPPDEPTGELDEDDAGTSASASGSAKPTGPSKPAVASATAAPKATTAPTATSQPAATTKPIATTKPTATGTGPASPKKPDAGAGPAATGTATTKPTPIPAPTGSGDPDPDTPGTDPTTAPSGGFTENPY